MIDADMLLTQREEELRQKDEARGDEAISGGMETGIVG